MSQMRDVRSTLPLRRCLPEKPTERGAKKFAAWCEEIHLPQFLSAFEVILEGGIHGGRNFNRIISNCVQSSVKIRCHH